MKAPKYSLPEIERRWLVEPSRLPELTHLPCRSIEDCYIEQSLLRLRRVETPDGEVAYKLCKKYGRHHGLANPIANLYLSPEEYLALCTLPGLRVRKQRYAVEGGAIDIYSSAPAFAIFEIDFDTEQAAADYIPPHFVGKEITDDSTYSGAALAARFGVHPKGHARGP